MSFTESELKRKSADELDAISSDLSVGLTSSSTSKADLIKGILAAQEDLSRPAELAIVDTEGSDSSDADDPTATNVRYRIILHNQEGPDASKFVKVQPNGVMYTIPRDVEVEVPEIVLNVLTDAVTTVTSLEDGKMVDRQVRRFPFTNLGKVK